MLANLVRLAGRSSTSNSTRGNLTSVAAGRGRTDSVVALVRCAPPHLPQLLLELPRLRLRLLVGDVSLLRGSLRLLDLSNRFRRAL